MFESKVNLKTKVPNKNKSSFVDKFITINEEICNLADELAVANKEKNKIANELVVAQQEKVSRAGELVLAKQEKVNRADELAIANKELAFQNKEKNKRADELAIAKQDKVNRADELVIANKELAFQNKEKNKRADELAIAKQDKVNRADELVIAKQDKVNRADELVIANKELAFQNKEKDKRADELAIAKQDKVNRADELVIANKELAFQNKEKNKRADELAIAEQDKVNRADELVIANKELAFQNKEKNKRADELVIAKQEKVNRADELAIAKQDKVKRADELIIAKQDKVNRADELAIANRELAYQNREKDKRANELVIANKELAFQNKEKDKRADELVIANEEKVILLRKLQLSQKMEAIGKLTGGISHEYNNMLGIITGYSELIKLNAANADLVNYANEIQYASKRAAKLTSKLLTFSQKKSANEDIININTLLERQHGMLEKTLTISINLIYKLQDNIWNLKIDGSDMEDAILNLCINAMHAMNEHGKLTIETKNKCITREDTNVLNIIPGDYVLLSFTDNGCGFNEKIKDKIFDPFFTTKGELGTGLGLSIVYNFVKNNGGGVSVNSVENKGTNFTFYFPRYHGTHLNQRQKKLLTPKMTHKNPQETGNILLVDDEPALLAVTSKILLSSGFNVFCAKDALQALKILEHECIDILISDVIMKKTDGYELAAIVKEKYPNIVIQIVSGFAENRNTDTLDINLYNDMLKKPVAPEVLIKRVRKLFNSK